MNVPTVIHLACGTEVPHASGTRVFDYYGMKPGVIERPATYPDPGTGMPSHIADGGAWWVTVRHDDGGTAFLDQDRMCSIEHAQRMGWLK